MPNRLAPATIAKRVMVAKQVFKKAVRWNWITKSPFEDMRSGSQVNAARLVYVSTETIEAVLDACPSIEWKVIVGLCRLLAYAVRLRWALSRGQT